MPDHPQSFTGTTSPDQMQHSVRGTQTRMPDEGVLRRPGTIPCTGADFSAAFRSAGTYQSVKSPHFAISLVLFVWIRDYLVVILRPV